VARETDRRHEQIGEAAREAANACLKLDGCHLRYLLV